MGFWTNDIGTAFLEFSTELDLTGTVASIVLENQYDQSLVQKTITEITSSPFYYQLGDEIQHEGRWFVQISVKKGEETIVSNSFAFMVNASVGHGKVARLVSIETFETLATQLTALHTIALADHASYEGLLTDGVLATNIENKLLYLETTYAPELNSVKQQLADIDADLQAGIGALTADAEVVTARNSSITGKTFSVLDARFEDVEADTTMMGTNLVTNGDFSNGTTGWTWGSVTPSVSNNKVRVLTTGGVGGEHFLIYKPLAGTIAQGRKYYVRGIVENILNSTLRFIVFNKKADGTYENTLDTAFSVSGARSLIFTPSSVNSVPDTQIRFQLRAIPDATSYVAVGNEELTVSYVSCIDLTATFGAGNEPTVEQMDAIMAKFENSWFDGTKNLFRASETLKKQIAIDARTEFDAKNLVVNGNFTTASNWTGNNATFVVANNIATITASGTTNYGDIFQNSSLPYYPANNKIYAMAKMKVLNADCTALALRVGISGGGTIPVVEKLAPVLNQQYTISGITSAPTSGILVLYARHQYIDATTATGKTAEVQYVTLIDLTATFGTGKEPTLAEMDRLMARYPNSWFDGTKPIQTIETLYQEKANKVQEAWITPTLLNGWTEVPGNTVRYMKDEMGFVHFKGRIGNGTYGTYAFVLPVGYRPSEPKTFLLTCSLSTSTGVRAYIPDGSLCPSEAAYGTYVDIASISYRAEA